jgi:hypothetical protein
MDEEVRALKDFQRRYAEEFDELVRKSMAKINERYQAVAKEREILSQLHPKLQKQQTSSIIILNVGGKKFSTSLSTLRSIQGTFFDTMFGERWNPRPLEDGSYFIDRDPKVFRYILNFLRDGTIDLDLLSASEAKAIEKDASFYQIPSLLALLATRSNYNYISNSNNNSNNNINTTNRQVFFVKPQEVSISNNSKTATATGGASSSTTFYPRSAQLNKIISVNSSGEIHRFKFKIENIVSWVGIGLYDQTRQDKPYSAVGHGFYALSHNGYLWHSDYPDVNQKPNGIAFAVGEIVEMVYNPQSKSLNFTSSVGRNVQIEVNCLRDLIPVVLLHKTGDSVSLVDE